MSHLFNLALYLALSYLGGLMMASMIENKFPSEKK